MPVRFISPTLATLAGLGAALLWSLLALLTAATGPVPPFQLLAMTFAIGGGVGAATWLGRPGGVAALRQPPLAWAVGIGGLFGYHALYFSALKLAPPAEAGLINYLWPLLIVLLSALLPGHGLKAAHVIGALLGLAGVATLLAGPGGLQARPDYWPGYLCAFACAFVWAGYSVLSRRFGGVSTDAVTGYCLATAALGLACHLLFEPTVWPDSPAAWGATVLNGLGPVGTAFYLWDIGMKRGDIRLLGVLSYAIPVLSTLVLVGAGYAVPTAALAVATGLIVAGALVAASAGARRSGSTR